MSSLQEKKVVIIGGSSGIGMTIAKFLLEEEAHVVIASRSKDKLEHAKKELAGRVETYVLDMTDEQQVKDFFSQQATSFDHLIITASDAILSDFFETEVAEIKQLFFSKFFGPYQVVKYAAPNISALGSITLFAGAAAFMPAQETVALGSVNAAVNFLGQALAVTLSPIRVNVVSPGIIDTPAHSGMDPNIRHAFFQSVAQNLPVQRIGTAEDVAEGVLYLIKNGFSTGSILSIDGGHSI
jgi:NAD(P)-dependent dehydrogenase (short-subunit alcohol dehydrogenase family)